MAGLHSREDNSGCEGVTTPTGAPRAAVVGAGISGASCAGALAAAGWEVDVFEKARGAGGRMSSRRIEQGWATLGTPFLSAKREPFRSKLRDWARQGWIAPVRGSLWRGRATISWGEAQLQNQYRPMIEPSQLVRSLLGGARLHINAEVSAVAPRTIVLADGRTLADYDCVVCSMPTTQAIPLLGALPLLQERLGAVRYRPIWTFLMRWEGGPAADVIKFDDHLLNLAVRQVSGGPGLWVVYSSHEFAETYLEAGYEEATTRGASALMGLLGLPWPVEVEAAHLWRHARPVGALGGFWVGDRENRVAVIGDGVTGVGVERAWESGTRLAQAMQQSKEELMP